MHRLTEKIHDMIVETYDPEVDASDSRGGEGMALADELLRIDREMDFRYALFLEESKYVQGYDGMREVLPRYFPEFEAGGSRPISEMNDSQVRGAFFGIKHTAEKICSP